VVRRAGGRIGGWARGLGARGFARKSAVKDRLRRGTAFIDLAEETWRLMKERC